MTVVELKAPLSGWATPLSEVPDPAFAGGLVGDGVAIDPTEATLRAPCDGVVLALHRARHACTVRAANGAEILMHIGVDTVELGGEGFVAHVRDDQAVRVGDPLITFDFDVVAGKAKSMLTMVVVANGEDAAVVSRTLDREVACGEAVMAVEGVATAEALRPVERKIVSRRVPLMIRTGLHARPAAALAALARAHAGAVTVGRGDRTANAKSVVALMGLGTALGDQLTVSAEEPGAEAVLTALAKAIADGLGDPVVEAAAAAAPMTASSHAAAPHYPAAPPFTAGATVVLRGTGAVAGLAVGVATRLDRVETAFPDAGAGATVESDRLAKARTALIARLETGAGAGAGGAGIFAAHRTLLDDPELTEATAQAVAAGASAERAWSEALGPLIAAVAALPDPRMAERAADLRDLRRQGLDLLAGRDPAATLAELPAGGVLVADEVMPSELAAFPAGKLGGLVMAAGGATSHAAIMAATMGIPTLVAVGPDALRIPNGAPLILDGRAGSLSVFPSAEDQETARDAAVRRAARRAANREKAREDCLTADGVRIEVFANVGKSADASAARDEGAEGCGLLRTEFLFLDRASAPSEDEQLAQYQTVVDALAGQPVIIRTLDAGADKPMAYVPIPREDNPALGVRGVRAMLRSPDLLRTQVRAILRVEPHGVARIMTPMVASLAELRAVRRIVEEERAALGRTAPIELGAMIEVPAAALISARLAAEAAFFSIGTNDLTQYALAMDRGNPLLAPETDSLHPAVLRLIGETVAGAAARGRTVAVCGGAASDPVAAPLLIGLGVTELSSAPAVIADLKAQIRTLSLPECREAAAAALTCESAAEVRDLVARRWPGL
jgi:phosphocarrier protein FPr